MATSRSLLLNVLHISLSLQRRLAVYDCPESKHGSQPVIADMSWSLEARKKIIAS